MRKIRIVFVVLLLILLGLALAIGLKSCSQRSSSTLKEETTAKSNQSTQTTKDSTTEERKIHRQRVYVGDSRFVGMSRVAEEEDIFICESKRGLDYLEEQMDQVYELCNAKTDLIIGLGVNDLRRGSEPYLELLNQMSQDLPCQMIYLTVNPVDEDREKSYGYTMTNEEIDTFNQEMKEGLSEKICVLDTNQFLNDIGYETEDGLHYSEETNQKLYDYISTQLDQNVENGDR